MPIFVITMPWITPNATALKPDLADAYNAAEVHASITAIAHIRHLEPNPGIKYSLPKIREDY